MHYGVATISRLLRITVSFAKEPGQRDYILQKRPIIWRSLLIVATPFVLLLLCLRIHRERGEGGWERERETERERLICDMSYLIWVTHTHDMSYSSNYSLSYWWLVWYELHIWETHIMSMSHSYDVSYWYHHAYESLIRHELVIWVTHTHDTHTLSYSELRYELLISGPHITSIMSKWMSSSHYEYEWLILMIWVTHIMSMSHSYS